MKIFTLIEHRRGKIRDVSYEVIAEAKRLAQVVGEEVTSILLVPTGTTYPQNVKQWVDTLIVIEGEVFTNFNSDTYQQELVTLLKDKKPFLLLLPHSAFGMELAPALAIEVGGALVTDCIKIEIKEEKIIVWRERYEGKMLAQMEIPKENNVILTLREGTFDVPLIKKEGKVVSKGGSVKEEPSYKRFIRYIEEKITDVDITKSDVIVSVGRGIKEKENLKLIEEFAKAIGGVVGCSRPIVDLGWLPKDRQVGSSGKTVKPKLYIAVGISGAFQHVMGMRGAETIIAINKDPNAPIFTEAHYGIVDDLFKVIPVLKDKILELKEEK